ncbi:MAG TPA: His-Xaa-Ser system radical SAM maturase HxsB [Thermoanaerobaculia bacterium]|nr:His-Xaa-Ser system radical SAM maturase HxsB [Thermoanaerobaculia bacterium]
MTPLESVHSDKQKPSLFRSIGHYRQGTEGYHLLPFRFMRWSAGEVLLVNDVGEFIFLESERFKAFVGHRLRLADPIYLDLKVKHFLLDSPSNVPIELLATKYRTKKSFLEGFAKLHLFVVTLRCDHSCHYCQVSRVSTSRSKYDMTRETARRAVDLMFRSPSPALKIEFQGGESLLNFDVIRHVLEYSQERNVLEGRDLEYVVATNLVPLTDEILEFLRAHSILLSTSLDGPELIHNSNRPRKGNDSHAITIRNLARAREALGHDRVSAVMTTTKLSLGHPREIVDEYVRQGFGSIFLRSISPYGYAVRTGEALRYETSEFLSFYKAALQRIIEVNREGRDLVEVYAQILLTKMLTPFPSFYVDLQSPAGAGIGAVAYNYDGEIYASDEARMLAEMGDKTFRLGNVHENTYEDVFGGETVRALAADSVLEALPGCADCAFLPYCGADPIFNHRTQGDVIGHRPTSAFCSKNMGILRHLFGLIREGDPFIKDLFTRWATGVRTPATIGEIVS